MKPPLEVHAAAFLDGVTIVVTLAVAYFVAEVYASACWTVCVLVIVCVGAVTTTWELA